MKILSIDTSSQNCSVAIVEIAEITGQLSMKTLALENSDDERTHSLKLMPMIKSVFSKTHLTLQDINLLACGVGPGSFTGIRIGIATVKAFCDSQDIPAVGVTSLESLAYSIEDLGIICSIIDAKHRNVYAGTFHHLSQEYHSIEPPISGDISSILEHLKASVEKDTPLYFVGNGAILYQEEIQKTFSSQVVHFGSHNVQSAVSLAKCAYQKYCRGLSGDSSVLSPVYLRKSQAERLADGEPI